MLCICGCVITYSVQMSSTLIVNGDMKPGLISKEKG